MSSKESIRFAGDISVEEVIIVTTRGTIQNVTNQVIGIQIFEDIFSPFISGTLTFKDSLDLTSLLPLVGEEYVKIKVRTPTFETPNGIIDKEFYIYKLSDKELINNATYIYRLHFISTEAIIDANKKLSRPHEGKVSDIVRDVIFMEFGLQYKGKANIEESVNGIKFVSNFWNPYKVIKYASERALNQKNSPSYLFFENRNGLNFVSLESLFANPVYQNFNDSQLGRSFTSTGSTYEDKNNTYSNIFALRVPEGFNYLESLSSGMYASKLISYDLLTKKYMVKNFDALEGFDKYNHLNKYPLLSDKAVRKNNSTIFYSPKYYGNYSNFGDVTDTNMVQRRASLLAQIQNAKIEITVAGRTDYTVGQTVNLTIFKKQPINASESNDSIKDLLLSGNYLIAAIHHFISKESHECIMELVKESLVADISK
jgi:hypothetical protein